MTHIGTYGLAVAAVLGIKLLLSIKPRKKPTRRNRREVTQRHLIHAVITVHNESRVMLERCLQSVIDQTLKPSSLTIIDDCSKEQDAATVVTLLRASFEKAGIDLTFIRFPVNRGKREGLAAGFSVSPKADVYLCVDSDTILDRDAVAEAAMPFNKRNVHAVTGLVLAANRATNILTRLIDMRYQNAFLGERVAYSRLGSVLCACGSLALYRGWVVRKHLDDFLGQRFLGRPCTFGDDRRLTYYCLIEGQSLIVTTAVAWTDVPETLKQFLRQQTRWTKSFIREGVLLFLKFRVHRAYWWLNLVELVTWVAFTSALLVAVFAFATNPHSGVILAWYAVYVSGAAWVRSLHYLRKAGNVPTADRVLTFGMAPLYALMNLSLLIPLRIWALATMRNTKWGTRQNGVEIQHAADHLTSPSVERAVPLKVLYDPHATSTTELPLPVSARTPSWGQTEQ